ncbi:MAG: A/G-specific adenine glycosylase [Verrucomicrobia bacterium]|nr:MAG: A/G-specific adenine glycosylase [Verrucomicrobiota bacterium]
MAKQIASKVEALVPALLNWFQSNARSLPWRRTRDPYAIWISEIMLQQTQVKTVIPYWRRWMRELPTVQSLAGARREKVLKLWEGLGYYTRAKNLQKAARMIVDRHGGRFPEKYDDLVALPGIGRYTAGAVLSIAFNQPAPVLDGNVIRVLTRLFGIAENPREKKTGATLWGLAEMLVRQAAPPPHPVPLPLRGGEGARRAGEGEVRGLNARPKLEVETAREPTCSHFNQALMELGATICTPRQPECSLCPVRKHCIAFRENRVADLPNLDQQAALTERRFVAFVAESRGRFPVRQRPAGVVNAHLWEFPNVEVSLDHRDIRQLAERLFGARPRSLKPLLRIRHSITRYRITLDVFRAEFADGLPRTIQAGRWCSLNQLRNRAFPSAHGKILKNLATEAERRSSDKPCQPTCQPHGLRPARLPVSPADSAIAIEKECPRRCGRIVPR